MKKIMVLLSSALIAVSCASLQQAERQQDKIRLGMSPGQIKEVLGDSPQVISYASEYSAYTNYGYVPEEQTVFEIGFDFILEYTPENNRTSIPAWKLYFKNNRLVYVNFSLFIYEGTETDFSGNSATKFLTKSLDEITAVLGDDYVFDNDGNSNYIYRNKGIILIFTDDSILDLKVVHIFDTSEYPKGPAGINSEDDIISSENTGQIMN